MQRLTDKYNVKEYIRRLEMQDRYTSKWDELRTDQAVFIQRTLNKWFSEKYFRIEIESRDSEYIYTSTKYVYIHYIRFGYNYGTKIVFYYTEPHSTNIQEIRMHYNDFCNIIGIQEAESDFRILQKFYPIRKEPKPNPFPQTTNIKTKSKS